MACFIVPAAEAIVTTIAAKVLSSKEKKADAQISSESAKNAAKSHFSKKLNWLNNMLWGGSALLALEHVWHGEVVPWFPFLTAASDPSSRAEMFHEMATVGVTMAALVTVTWAIMVLVSSRIEKRVSDTATQKN